MWDRYLKIARVAPTSRTTKVDIASMSIDHWNALYGISNYMLKDDGTQLTEKVFESLSTIFTIQTPNELAYHTQTST